MSKHRLPGKAASNSDRNAGFRDLRPSHRILIVCEGTETEPNYFNALIRVEKLNGVDMAGGRPLDINAVGAAHVSLSLTEYALTLQSKRKERYEEIWCVFGKDDCPADAFDNAISRAENHDFLRVAWSNEAFELWYVVHFEYLDSAPGLNAGPARKYYRKRLDKLLDDKYDKSHPDMYTQLLGGKRLETAMKNARRLMDCYPAGTPCHQCIPATTVHLLVENLLRYATGAPRELSKL